MQTMHHSVLLPTLKAFDQSAQQSALHYHCVASTVYSVQSGTDARSSRQLKTIERITNINQLFLDRRKNLAHYRFVGISVA